MKISLILPVVALLTCAGPASMELLKRQRSSLYEPIFAYDDIDAHTVSAGYQEPKEVSARNKLAAPSKPVETVSRAFPSTPAISSQTASSTVRIVQSSLPVQQSTTETRVSKRTSQSQSTPQNHWSALENYYRKLGQASQQQQQQQSLLPVYQLIHDEQDERLNPLKVIQSTGQAPYSTPTINQLSNGASLINPFRATLPASRNPAFLLPLDQIGSTAPSSVQKVEPQDLDANVYWQAAPGISRIGGIGGSSILRSGSSSNAQPQQQQSIIPYQQQQQIVQYEPQEQNLLRLYDKVQPQNYLTNLQSPTYAGGPIADSKNRFLEWRKLPELLIVQQQQQRLKHQQETFGSWYDHQRTREMLQEEVYCGPRNQIVMSPARLAPMLVRGSTKIQYDSSALSRLQAQGWDGADESALARPGVGEYPSHIGLYNGTQPSTDNFLCSATWIHERFAITVASCLRQVTDLNSLTIRIGEWNLNKNSSQTISRAMVTRNAKQVHLFPKYRNDSSDHNLALVEFSSPVEFLDTPYICPACQLQSRTSLRANSCWTPSRNITYVEYFDAEGDGETKERKEVSMVELPVKLIANNDQECQRQTKIELFNYQYPNYICSDDYRSSSWRAKLNQTSNFGSGIYCNEGGQLNLVSIVHPIRANTSSSLGYLDLSYYKPWIRNVISGRNF